MISEQLQERMSSISSTEFLEYIKNILGKEFLIYITDDTLEILKENRFEIKSISMVDIGFQVILNKGDKEYEGFGELVEEAIAEAIGYEFFVIQHIKEEEIININLDDINLDDIDLDDNKEKSGSIENNAELMDIKIMDKARTTLAYYKNNCMYIRLTQKDIKKYLGVPYYNNIYEMIIDIINHECMHHIISLEIGHESSFLYNEICNSIEDKNDFK